MADTLVRLGGGSDGDDEGMLLVTWGRTAARDRVRVGGWSAAVMITVGLAATLLGGGRIGHAANASDGAAWLWSRPAGEVARINPDDGRVERRREVTDARGHRVRVTQNDRHLLIHDLDTGRVSSLDLNGLGMSGRLDVGTRGDPHLAMGPTAAAVIERTTGAVRAVDPSTLQPVGDVLQLPGPVTGGEFDGTGRLWAAVPRQGTVVAMSVTAEGVSVEETTEVAEPGRDLVLSVLDEGALVVDRSGRDLVVAGADGTRRATAPVPLASALVPDRIHGELAAITVPAAGSIVTVGDVREAGPVTSFPLRDPVQEPAVPFAGKVYVPVRETGQVRVFDPAGRQTGVLSMPGGRTELELQVREGNLFVNAPGRRDAQVVGADGRVRRVGKFPDGPDRGGDRPVAPRDGSQGPPRIPAPSVEPIFPNPFEPDPPRDERDEPEQSSRPRTPSQRPTDGTTPPRRWPRRPETSRTPSAEPSGPRPSPSSGAPTATPSSTRPTAPATRPTTPRPTTRPTTPRPTTEPPKTSTPKPRPTTSKPKPKPTATKNPYTPQQVCGSGYVVQRSVAFTGGRVYQLYSNATKKNCAVAMKTSNVGKGTNVWVRLEEQKGGEVGYDSGTFKYYAGPVYVHAPGVCVRISGGASGSSASTGWANCG